jgi:hypothetical protein
MEQEKRCRDGVMETNTDKEKLPRNFSHTLHERVRESSHELRKLLIGFSAGGLALIFAALTEKTEPALSIMEKWVCGVGLLSFGLSLLSGLIAWKYGSDQNYYWAHELNAEDNEKNTFFKNIKIAYMKKGYLAVRMLTFFFGIGVLCLTMYGVLRLKSI